MVTFGREKQSVKNVKERRDDIMKEREVLVKNLEEIENELSDLAIAYYTCCQLLIKVMPSSVIDSELTPLVKILDDKFVSLLNELKDLIDSLKKEE